MRISGLYIQGLMLLILKIQENCHWFPWVLLDVEPLLDLEHVSSLDVPCSTGHLYVNCLIKLQKCWCSQEARKCGYKQFFVQNKGSGAMNILYCLQNSKTENSCQIIIYRKWMKDNVCHYSSAGLTEEYNTKNKQIMNKCLVNTFLMYVIFFTSHINTAWSLS